MDHALKKTLCFLITLLLLINLKVIPQHAIVIVILRVFYRGFIIITQSHVFPALGAWYNCRNKHESYDNYDEYHHCSDKKERVGLETV